MPSQPGLEGLDEADLRAMSAMEGLDTLTGDFAEVKPEIVASDFPGPIAEAFYWDDNKVVGIQGPVGSGKTTTLLKSRLRRAAHMPPSMIDGIRRYRLLITRATYRQLWSTTIPDFLGVYPKHLGQWEGGRGGPVLFRMDFEDDFTGQAFAGGEIGPIRFEAEFMAFGDDIVAAMRGLKPTDIWGHEFDTNPADFVPNAITRIGRYPDQEHFDGYPADVGDVGQLVGDMNAMDQDNFAFSLFHDKDRQIEILRDLNRSLPEGSKPIDIKLYRQPGFGEEGCENLHNLTPTYYQVQIATNKMLGRGDLIDRLVYNKTTFLRIGDPVFQREFNRDLHVARETIEPYEEFPLRIGLDQGFKGAAIIGQFIEPSQFLILSELMFPSERVLAKEFGRRLREHLDEKYPGMAVEFGLGDMAGEQGSSLADDENETWNMLVSGEAGFPIRPQRIGTNRIQPRLEAVRARLETIRGGKPGLLIDPSCTGLIAGFEARYVWADEIDASGDKRKVPNKRIAEANLHDALQYLLLSESLADGSALDTHSSTRDRHRRHNGGPPLENDRGLVTDYDLLNPYGD